MPLPPSVDPLGLSYMSDAEERQLAKRAPQMSAGQVQYDPTAIARTRAADRAPLALGAALGGPLAMGTRMLTRAPIMAAGVRQQAKQRALEAALRDSRQPTKVEAMFAP